MNKYIFIIPKAAKNTPLPPGILNNIEKLIKNYNREEYSKKIFVKEVY